MTLARDLHSPSEEGDDFLFSVSTRGDDDDRSGIDLLPKTRKRVLDDAGGDDDEDEEDEDARDYGPTPEVEWVVRLQPSRDDWSVELAALPALLFSPAAREELGSPVIHGLAAATGRWTYVGAGGAPTRFRALALAYLYVPHDQEHERSERAFGRYLDAAAKVAAMPCDDALAEWGPALARLAQTAVGTQPPAGPEIRRCIGEVSLPGWPGFTVSGALCVAEQGFSLHAATRVGAHDDLARERLVRYVLRPPLATERLRILDNELVRLELKKPFSDGTVAIDMDPLSLLWRPCATVPSCCGETSPTTPSSAPTAAGGSDCTRSCRTLPASGGSCAIAASPPSRHRSHPREGHRTGKAVCCCAARPTRRPSGTTNSAISPTHSSPRLPRPRVPSQHQRPEPRHAAAQPTSALRGRAPPTPREPLPIPPFERSTCPSTRSTRSPKTCAWVAYYAAEDMAAVESQSPFVTPPRTN